MRSIHRALLAGVLLAACGGGGASPDVDAAIDAQPPDAYVGPDASAACVASIEALAAALSQGSCSVVVRLDYTTRAVLGYHVTCGPNATPVSEAQARAMGESDTGYGDPATDVMLNVGNDESAFVFFRPAGDSGGIAAVNARSGLTLFGGSVIWSGTGEITYPQSWRPASELAEGCPPGDPGLQRHGYDLEVDGRALAASEVDAAVDVVRQTAVPAAFARNEAVFDMMVLLYPRTLGPLDATTAEWIVLVNAVGFLLP